MDHTLIFQRAYDAYRLAADLTLNFPKKDRYSLGVRIELNLLALLEHILTAETTVPSLKDRELIAAAVKADIGNVLMRLALERKLIQATNYHKLSETLREIAKMANGWRKSLR